MTLEKFYLLIYVQLILSVLTSAMSFVYFRRKTLESKLIGFVFLTGVIVMFITFNLSGKIRNIPQSLHVVISFVLLSIIYYKAYRYRYGKHLFSIALAFVFFSIVNILYIQKNDINTFTRIISALIFIFYSIVYFYRLLKDLPVHHLQRSPMFWYNAGILIYNAGTLFLLLFTSYLENVLHDNLLIYWTLHNIVNIIQHFIIMIGLGQEFRYSNLSR